MASVVFPDLLEEDARPPQTKTTNEQLVQRQRRQHAVGQSAFKIIDLAGDDELLDELLDESEVGEDHGMIPHEDFEEDCYVSRRDQSPSSSKSHGRMDFLEELDCGRVSFGSESGYQEDGYMDRHHSSEIFEDVNVDTMLAEPKLTTKADRSDNTSKTGFSDYSPKNALDAVELILENEGSEVSSFSSMRERNGDNTTTSGSSSSEDAAALLERAQDRIARQHLQEEVESLKEVLEQKKKEIESLTGQLRQAVATKCDLVIAHNELEKSHEKSIKRKENNLMQMKKANICLLESQSMTEKQMLNELIRLTDLCNEQETKHRQELDDWERMHRNEMLEKDFEIAKLTEELRKTKLSPGQSDQTTVKSVFDIIPFLNQ